MIVLKSAKQEFRYYSTSWKGRRDVDDGGCVMEKKGCD
jgi:hypothetical protein